MDRLAVTEWIAFSDMDLASAKHLCSMIPKPLEIICYLCPHPWYNAFNGIVRKIEARRVHLC